jgi:hypothetical protein
MKPYIGISVSIFCDKATEDSFAYAKQLAKALRDAGITVDGPNTGTAFGEGPILSGISISAGEDRLAAANALGVEMRALGLINAPIPGSKNSARKDAFDVMIEPNH